MPAKINISHYRGDTFKRGIRIASYEPSEGDIIKFGLKRNKSDPECILEKNIDPTKMVLRLESEDTQALDEGSYYYDIQIDFATDDGRDVNTFIAGKFTLTADVVK